MSLLERLYQEYKDKGFLVIQVIGRDRPGALRSDAPPVSYTTVVEADLDLQVSGYPTFVMLDRDGNIVGNQTGFADRPGYDEAALRRILAEADVESIPAPRQNSPKSKKKMKALDKKD
jgi:hypothetical protein